VEAVRPPRRARAARARRGGNGGEAGTRMRIRCRVRMGSPPALVPPGFPPGGQGARNLSIVVPDVVPAGFLRPQYHRRHAIGAKVLAV
jgi:hypothetical protein